MNSDQMGGPYYPSCLLVVVQVSGMVAREGLGASFQLYGFDVTPRLVHYELHGRYKWACWMQTTLSLLCHLNQMPLGSCSVAEITLN